jgi:hypothetical protein
VDFDIDSKVLRRLQDEPRWKTWLDELDRLKLVVRESRCRNVSVCYRRITLLYRPIHKVDELDRLRIEHPMVRRSFCFSFELSYLRGLRKPGLAGTPEVRARLSRKALEVPGLIMQNDLAWS